MNYLQDEANPAKRFGGLSVVLLFHLLLGYALITGLARRAIEIINRPVETKIIEEVKPPPPEETPPPPQMKAPPPPYMPPPEVRIQEPPTTNTITQVTNVPPPVQQFVKTPQPTLPVEPAAKPAPAVASPPPVPAFVDLNACKPEYPRTSLIAEEQGTVRVRFVIGAAGQLVSAAVMKSSGYKSLDRAAVEGLSRCKFKPAYQDGKPVQSAFISDYVWTLAQ